MEFSTGHIKLFSKVLVTQITEQFLPHNLNKYNLPYRRMTTTLTTTETEEVTFVNIITLAEDKLQTNFRLLSNKLKKHDDILREHQSLQREASEKTYLYINNRSKQTKQQMVKIQERLSQCLEMIEMLKHNQTQQNITIESNQRKIDKQTEELRDLKLMLDETDKRTENELNDARKQLQEMRKNIQKAFDDIMKKQDSTEVNKIHQKVNMIGEKTLKNEKQCQHLDHKFQKMDITFQKVERNQAKRELQIMKEVEEKIKKDMKVLQKSLGIKTPAGLIGVSSADSYSDDPVRRSSGFQPVDLERNLRDSSQYEEDESKVSKQSVEKLAVSKINEKMLGLENKLKAIENSVEKLKSSKQKSKDNEVQMQIMDKINEMKPELIKIWAKCDTLDDKIAFNERKLEDRTKTLSSLVDAQKENNVGKLDDKLKIFQTEMYSTLKDIKSKVQNKVNTPDYEKYCMSIDDRVRQINELIFLKSDKLEVKKALLFLESKIKEIILVISEEEQNEKDALLTKKQLKCMSCDKDIDKIPKAISSAGRGNWDAMPLKDHAPELLGKFGMTNYGSLGKRIKRLESGDLPILNARRNRNHLTNRDSNIVVNQSVHE